MTEPAQSHLPTLHLAALDHRESFRRMLAEVDPAAATAKRRVALKLLIWRGIASRLDASGHAGVLVDPDAGEVVDAARNAGAVTAMALEASGRRWLAPDRPPAELAQLVDRHRPTYGKVLMRWHPADSAEERGAQVATLTCLLSLARDGGSATLLELLVPPAGTDAALADAHPDAYRSEVLPVRLADAIHQLADAGIEPDLWKIDGLDRAGTARVVGHAVAATSGGRAGIVVLGAGRELADLAHWFAASAGIPGYCGFAVGRSIWWDAVRRHIRGEIDEPTAEAAIGDEFAAVVDTYEHATGQ